MHPLVFPLQANLWCARGIVLLDSQRIDKCSVSLEIAEECLLEIREFVSSANEFRGATNDDAEMRCNIFEDSTTPETRALVTQVSNNKYLIL